MKNIAANELKTKGVTTIRKALEDGGEAVISVRGQERYIVMDLATYNRLRECELEAALHESRREIESGKYVEESVEDHIRRIAKAAD